MAYGIARSPTTWRSTLLMLIILPFWTSFLIRVYAWMRILKNNGLINNFLIWLGVINDPIPMMNTNFAVFIGIVYSYLPFMILPLYSTLEKMDLSLLEAAEDLGCRPWKAFLQITVPLAMPGIIAGSMLVFIPRGRRIRHPRIARRVRQPDDRAHPLQRVFQQPRLARGLGRGHGHIDHPGDPHRRLPALPEQAGGGRGMNKGLSWFVLTLMIVGYLFLYGPILSLIVYSFNVSKLVTVWGGFSFKWYGVLAQDDAIIRAVKLSFLIAAVSATAAAILGTMAGYVLARFRRFKGRLVFTGMVSAPLVMPEVITGLSMLLLFVSMEQLIGWPAGRGKVTIILAHTTFCLTYVAVILQARLSQLDQSLEEAALDLGCRPLKTFFVITLPIIAPAIVSGWLLAFTLSLDDVVISSFTTGPGATTLPMEVFSRVRLGLNPEINALATIIIAAVASGILLASIFMSRQEKRRQRDMQMAIAANK